MLSKEDSTSTLYSPDNLLLLDFVNHLNFNAVQHLTAIFLLLPTHKI